MKILIDAMGGDNAPNEIIKGVLQSDTKAKIILVGKEAEIKKHLTSSKNIDIINATEVIGMAEASLAIRQKKDSSLVVALENLKAGEGEALISAGSTGALVAGATLMLKRIQGIKRPSLAVPLPTEKGITLLMDAGANVDCKPEYLLQWGILGTIYMKELGIAENPKVGLLSNGSEEDKGNAFTKETAALLKEASNINFYGNIEAKEVPTGVVDILLADGFAGNILLKTAEGYLKLMGNILKKELKSSPINTLGAILSKKALNKTKSFFDPSKVGAVQFLGVDKLVLKAHGSSNSDDIAGAIETAEKLIKLEVISKVKLS
ncbi:MAG: phosphate acyltransferase PlsX [Defluviitaleaceae bacterium]|nr:phosphate acyltransferase PlsX [Defluviitaleaceae bacterium]